MADLLPLDRQGATEAAIVDYHWAGTASMKTVKTLPPMHPGEMLREEFLEPRLTPYAVAKACGVPRTRIERIAREELGISADRLK